MLLFRSTDGWNCYFVVSIDKLGFGSEVQSDIRRVVLAVTVVPCPEILSWSYFHFPHFV